ncbi:hypothetical protein FNI45_06750 [Salmonella enterica subsp. salamae]|nr:hypothetical protein [Salmonella enterica subsp. salamae]EEL7719988.1 hypothetical protein [Salmonella enterica]ECC1655071.1 hypothetical protein [Salmonella enterica subsp. salamae]ECD9413865.1 hypothetical protein [Salmonella enterica subsp. salamae]ECF5930317.1 hypothetical protein [Salmonella enterica subsp. salamae]
MGEKMGERDIRQYIAAHPDNEIGFTWQGGDVDCCDHYVYPEHHPESARCEWRFTCHSGDFKHRIYPAANRWHNHLDKKSMIQAEIEHPTGHTQQNFAHHRNIAEMAGVERHLSVTTICSGFMLISVFRSQAANAMLADIFNVIRVGEFRHYTNLTFSTTRGCSITPQSAVRRRTCSEAFYALATENIL